MLDTVSVNLELNDMARPKDEDLGDDFSYILRMADTDMDGLKPLATALTSVKGVLGSAQRFKFAKTQALTLSDLLDSSTSSNKKNCVWPLNPTQRPFQFGC